MKELNQKKLILEDEATDLNVLLAIQKRGIPTGATALTDTLGLPQATLGRIMNRLEQSGYLLKVSNKGRILSDSGHAYLEQRLEQKKIEAAAEQIIDSSASLSLQKLIEILEIRRDLEQQSARGACMHASDEELDALNGLMLEYLYVINRGELGALQDQQFHLALARCSGNETLYQILTLLLTTRHAFTDFAVYSRSFLVRQAESHHTIVKALLARDCDAAASAVAEHLDTILNSLREKKAEEPSASAAGTPGK